MKTFRVTFKYQDKLDTVVVYGHHTVSGLKKFITNHWNREGIQGSKIIKVEILKDEDSKN